MLIVLDKSLNDSLESTISDDEVMVLDSIATAWQHGVHSVIGDRALFEKLSRCADLSRPTRAAYGKLTSAVTTLAAGFEKMLRRLTIVGHGADQGQSDRGILISLQSATRLLPFDQTTLLVENHADGRFFEVVGSHYLRREGLDGVCLSLDILGGGGNTTASAFELLRRDNRKLCLCIVDSDRKSRGGTVGETARPLLRREGLEETREVCVLAVREAENLLPLQILSTALRTTEDIVGKQRMLEAIAELERGADVLAFLDMKRGLSYWEASRPDMPPAERDIIEVLRNIDPVVSRMEQHSSCQNCGRKSDCRCLVIEGLGTTALTCVTDVLKVSTVRELPQLTPVQEAEWLRVGALVASWGCAQAPRAAL